MFFNDRRKARDSRKVGVKAQRRFNFLIISAGCATFLILGNFFYLHVFKKSEYESFLLSRRISDSDPVSFRGEILFQDKDHKLFAAAVTKKAPFLFSISKDIPDAEAYAEVLTDIVGVDQDELFSRLSKHDDPYELLKRKLTDAEVEKVKDLALEGVIIGQEERRYYPLGSIGAQILGFVSYDASSQGQYGVEQYFQEVLKGKNISVPSRSFTSYFFPQRSKTSIILTIDPKVQNFVERSMDAVREQWNADSAFFVVMDPQTGKVIAMRGSPSFDPNQFHEVSDLRVFLNPIIASVFEVGSVMKSLTMSSALDKGAVSPQTTYYDRGKVQVGSKVIENFDAKERGVQTMGQVLEQSLNTGSIFAMQKLGKENFYSYLKNFGLDEKTGIELPGEVSGSLEGISDPRREVEFATASFGSGISVTPLAFTRALAVLANGGKLMKPYVVDRVIEDGKVISKTEPQVVRQVISPQTSQTITKMLSDVVEHTLAGGKVRMSGYTIAAKTGTAQLPLSDGKGYSSDFTHTFFGYFPATRPRAVIFLGLIRPHGIRYASQSLSPVFVDITKFMLNYYDIPPDNFPVANSDAASL